MVQYALKHIRHPAIRILRFDSSWGPVDDQ